MIDMVRNFIIDLLEGRARKFIISALGTAVTWVSAEVFPLDQFVSDANVAAIGATITSVLVYAVRNVDFG